MAMRSYNLKININFNLPPHFGKKFNYVSLIVLSKIQTDNINGWLLVEFWSTQFHDYIFTFLKILNTASNEI